MGWIGIPCEGKPKGEEIDRMVEERFVQGSQFRIIDRSGRKNYGDHQFLLLEERESRGGEKPERFVLVALVQHRNQELRLKAIEETSGPNELDCPMRIMRQLEGYPPRNESSANWRRKVMEHHQERKKTGAIMRRLRTE